MGLQDPNFTLCHLTLVYSRLCGRGPTATQPAEAATALIAKIGNQANNIASKSATTSEIGITEEGKHSRNVISYHLAYLCKCMGYSSPETVVTIHPKLGGFKQQKFILSWLWKPEVWHQGGSLCKGTLPYLFPFFMALGIPWLEAISLQYLSLWSHLYLSLCLLLFCLKYPSFSCH